MVNATTSLITKAQLRNARRVLYMSHLALGDYYYQRHFLQQLVASYPQLQLDIWFDDCRRHPGPAMQSRNAILGQWLEADPWVTQIYPGAESPQARQQQLSKARSCNYDLVIFIATHRAQCFAHLARQICPKGVVVGVYQLSWMQRLLHHSTFANLNGSLSIAALPIATTTHISERYRCCFAALLGLQTDAGPAPLSLPSEALQQIQSQLLAWQQRYAQEDRHIVLINPLSTSRKRNLSWPKLLTLMHELKAQHPQLIFVVNVPPHAVATTQRLIDAQSEKLPALVFTAEQSFFQLPAMLASVDLVISVETATMHFASAMNTPLIALMRDKTMHWQPLRASAILFTSKRVDDIDLETLLAKCARVLSRLPQKVVETISELDDSHRKISSQRC